MIEKYCNFLVLSSLDLKSLILIKNQNLYTAFDKKNNCNIILKCNVWFKCWVIKLDSLLNTKKF